MDIARAARWFARTSLEGWNGTTWKSNVARGDFHAFDRFITERTFGAKKRVFHTPQDYPIDTGTYPVVRSVDGKVWIVTSDNVDVEWDQAYAHSYLLLEATLQCGIIEHTTETLASGAEGPKTETTVSTHYCDLERYSASNSDLFANVTYGGYEITMHNGVTVTTDNELKINGVYYEIKEVIPELLTTVCRCLKRK